MSKKRGQHMSERQVYYSLVIVISIAILTLIAILIVILMLMKKGDNNKGAEVKLARDG